MGSAFDANFEAAAGPLAEWFGVSATHIAVNGTETAITIIAPVSVTRDQVADDGTYRKSAGTVQIRYGAEVPEPVVLESIVIDGVEWTIESVTAGAGFWTCDVATVTNVERSRSGYRIHR